jgi:hypothetical protein
VRLISLFGDGRPRFLLRPFQLSAWPIDLMACARLLTGLKLQRRRLSHRLNVLAWRCVGIWRLIRVSLLLAPHLLGGLVLP